ncbi:hypothetical protein ASG47_19705 [Devosia sp. Leaf420]|uniref:major capsid protein n=1 Tax=Devosia sp. Leaf420 TaxID=1736374 RepID=UPI0007131298|nr:major capsid protein [Devosia sp. Leaf420]KQT50331.1 hypothetical protein ASG47_19705 [Devosia sp. Leaf420]
MDPEEFNFLYTSTSLTEAVNRIPNTYGLLNAMGMFNTEGTASILVEVRIENGIVRVLSAQERGGPGIENKREKGNSLIFKIPHFPQMDLITPQDIQNMIALVNRTKRPATMDDEVAKRLDQLRTNHAITREFVRVGALKGVIIDGDGTELYNLFDEFDITKKTVDFALGSVGTDIMGKCEEVHDHVVANLKGEVSDGVEVMVSGSFFSRLVNHAKVEKFYLQAEQAMQLTRFERDRLGGNWGRVFEFGNIRFRENKTTFPLKIGTDVVSTAAIESGKGHAYPSGTRDTFKTWDAPADTITAVNSAPDDEIFISSKVLDHGKGVELWSESNTLSICKRPETLVEVFTSN